MQAQSFLTLINPWQLAAHNERLEGELVLAALPRLLALNCTGGSVSLVLEGGIDEKNVRFLKGRLRADVELICQRCLCPLRLTLDTAVCLGLARSEAEVNRLPDSYEPLLTSEDKISLPELVEDELLLALPQIPRHEDWRECEANGYVAPIHAPVEAQRRQPFAALERLLPQSKSKE